MLAVVPGKNMVVIATKIPSWCESRQQSGKTFLGLRRSDGTDFYQYDRRLKWVDNTLGSPASVSADEYAGGRHGVCPRS
jgi:hypothetical protein